MRIFGKRVSISSSLRISLRDSNGSLVTGNAVTPCDIPDIPDVDALKSSLDDPSSIECFEDWLKADSRFGVECFQLKSYRESNQLKLTLEALKESSDDLQIIPKLIRNDSTTNWLRLDDSKLQEGTRNAVLKAFVDNKTIEFLSLTFNGINDSASASIKEVLTHNSTITTLDLKNNDLGDEGCGAIMSALETNKSLINLDLRRNSISAKACPAIKNTLLANSTLQKLELRGNSIGNEGCNLIIDGLYNNTTLSKITLGRNNVDEDICEKCISLAARNDIIQKHVKATKEVGISFYVSIETKNNKEYLTWARDDDSNTPVDEATKSRGSLALVVFIDILRSIIDPVNEDLSLSDPFSLRIANMLRDRKQLRRLVNQKINNDTYIIHMLAESEHSTSLKFLKFFVNRCDASFYTTLDSKGLCARAIALTSMNTEMREWAKTHGSFLGRYIIEGGKGIHSNPVHKSKYSIVHLARDVTKLETDPRHHVAIKIMNEKESYERERNARLKSHTLFTISSGEDIPEIYSRYSSAAIAALYRYHDEIDEKGQRYQCLVFEKMGKNLHRIIESEKIGGQDERRVLFYGKTLGKAVQLMHSTGYIHADLKTRNAIRANDNIMKLIDLDSTVAKGEELTGEFSSAFVSPEIARARFDLMGVDGKSSENENTIEEQIIDIEKQIIEHQRTISGLNLTESTNMVKYSELNEKIQALLARRFLKKSSKASLLADESVDIWGFGVIMYILCTSRPLFWYDLMDNLANETEKNRLLTWQGLSREDLDKVVPSLLSTDFRENAITFLMKCLHVDPTERFQSMDEVLDHDIFHLVNDD